MQDIHYNSNCKEINALIMEQEQPQTNESENHFKKDTNTLITRLKGWLHTEKGNLK